MKRSEQKNIDETIYGLTFYLDDLEGIVELINEHEYILSVSDNTYEYSDLAELASENPKGLKSLTISANSPEFGVDRVSIHISGNITSLYGYIMSQKTRTLFLSIKHKLGSGRSYRYVTLFPSIILLCAAIPVVLVFLVNSLSSTPPTTNYYYPAWILWGLISLVGYFLFARNWFKKPVVTVHRRKKERLWDRYGEQLIFMLFGAMLTILGALLITYLQNKFFP